jgi:nicotinate dehydrogenase subunit A
MARISELDVNGARRQVDADAERTLLSVLRDDLDLTGTKYGCGEGQCAACTVLIDGQPTRSCLTKVGAVAGKRIVTIEGLAPEGNAHQSARLHPVQEAFLEADAMQCGWCTPGMILGAVGLLRRTPHPTAAEIANGMNGHICRCGTYPRIVAAIQAAARKGGRI